MRFMPSPHEALLWEALKGSRLGVGFRRQVLLSCATKKLYIVDFCAPSVKLVVEVDDASHRNREEQDARRDAALRPIGYRVVRIPVALLERNFAGAVELIRVALSALGPP
jgi:very-short-patch-repair endonuclease